MALSTSYTSDTLNAEVLDVGTDWKRIQLLLTDDMVERIDEWRRQQKELPDRNTAIRQLIEAQLQAAGLGSKQSGQE